MSDSHLHRIAYPDGNRHRNKNRNVYAHGYRDQHGNGSGNKPTDRQPDIYPASNGNSNRDA